MHYGFYTCLWSFPKTCQDAKVSHLSTGILLNNFTSCCTNPKRALFIIYVSSDKLMLFYETTSNLWDSIWPWNFIWIDCFYTNLMSYCLINAWVAEPLGLSGLLSGKLVSTHIVYATWLYRLIYFCNIGFFLNINKSSYLVKISTLMFVESTLTVFFYQSFKLSICQT